ncbi:hypothetical protein METBIDRAFT_30082 [Metschnikowia bicuspidata var. bicuspidata NRRL YB-4993]|uniref:Uncharacterized protein n=1 Tax=Metschnikowia bicuspidata var. bicuspidata NRRL YB-4993 TaxID=869754 RepID=A0A1A0HHK5_9ASCO|nr:hypothetical protein METBIDRAFT_30082 [Metschnikowia bicuspidata var. bicuspidata NRRL YB-4993]OBA23644.1 hypothetical protein METBIDRAFT_30082 [Metschnikowia bicuspidata var. bicuspidata NRRL YB-4993]
MPGKRIWSIEQEILLLSLVCDSKPAGAERDNNIAKILVNINENITGEDSFTEEQIWTKLADFFDLQKIEDIEKDSEGEPGTPRKEERSRSSAGAKSKDEPTRESTVEQRGTPDAAGPKPETNSPAKSAEPPELYSSELSDVEGEETELEKLHDKNLTLPPPREIKRRGRPKKAVKRLPAKENASKESLATTPKKRMRPTTKDGEDESAPKRRPLSSQGTRRKAKTDTTPEAEQASNQPSQAEDSAGRLRDDTRRENTGSGDEVYPKDEEPANAETKSEIPQDSEIADEGPKTRRSRRQAVRRSTRNK